MRGVTFIAYPGSAYAGDWSNLVPGLMTAPVLMLVAVVIIPFYRRAVGMSAYEYFGKRYGYPARVYSSIAFALGHFSKMGFVFYLLALTVTSMTGWETERVIVGVGVVTVCYTLIGGIEAVIWADVQQGFALWAGIAICIGYLLFAFPGGIAEENLTGYGEHVGIVEPFQQRLQKIGRYPHVAVQQHHDLVLGRAESGVRSAAEAQIFRQRHQVYLRKARAHAAPP